MQNKTQGLGQGWGICGPCDLLIWPASEFLLPNSENKIGSQRSSMTSTFLDSMTRESLVPQLKV